MVFAFYFKVPKSLTFLPVGAQPFGFALLLLFREYPWQVYVSCGVSSQSMPGSID